MARGKGPTEVNHDCHNQNPNLRTESSLITSHQHLLYQLILCTISCINSFSPLRILHIQHNSLGCTYSNTPRELASTHGGAHAAQSSRNLAYSTQSPIT
ncbi:hypothetical protein RHMOL_Rhmol11G0028600 [Rhododendron molle]|uniref:Uncharacterized protein n=1 Tax=Rhododendron molle TaxID=49168 RepID=A0ACC0LNC4_RHOML|nr:hypothetical protein RHMOL_Rhmol11G0028600 [Rhododendron molle]